MLVHVLERRARDRFKSNTQHGTAAFGCKLEHAVVLRKFGSDTGLPLDTASLQRAHHLLRALRGTEKVGIVDRDGARTAVLHLVNHFLDRPITELEAVHQRLGAERASLMAAA